MQKVYYVHTVHTVVYKVYIYYVYTTHEFFHIYIYYGWVMMVISRDGMHFMALFCHKLSSRFQEFCQYFYHTLSSSKHSVFVWPPMGKTPQVKKKGCKALKWKEFSVFLFRKMRIWCTKVTVGLLEHQISDQNEHPKCFQVCSIEWWLLAQLGGYGHRRCSATVSDPGTTAGVTDEKVKATSDKDTGYPSGLSYTQWIWQTWRTKPASIEPLLTFVWFDLFI